LTRLYLSLLGKQFTLVGLVEEGKGDEEEEEKKKRRNKKRREE